MQVDRGRRHRVLWSEHRWWHSFDLLWPLSHMGQKVQEYPGRPEKPWSLLQLPQNIDTDNSHFLMLHGSWWERLVSVLPSGGLGWRKLQGWARIKISSLGISWAPPASTPGEPGRSRGFPSPVQGSHGTSTTHSQAGPRPSRPRGEALAPPWMGHGETPGDALDGRASTSEASSTPSVTRNPPFALGPLPVPHWNMLQPPGLHLRSRAAAFLYAFPDPHCTCSSRPRGRPCGHVRQLPVLGLAHGLCQCTGRKPKGPCHQRLQLPPRLATSPGEWLLPS